MKFQDRVSTYPNRYKLKKSDGTSEYVTLERADSPTQVGTPLNADTFNAMQRGHTPHNLLDNSDFRNPVNQRGFAGGVLSVDNAYFIDRWKTQQSTEKNIEINLSDSGLIIRVSAGLAGIEQKIPTPKTDVTLAAKVNGKIAFVHARYGEEASTRTDDNVVLYVNWLENVLQVLFQNSGAGATDYTIEWAALYEGEYTAETLPEYQPKGYGAELAECLRYYQCSEIGVFISNNAYRDMAFHLPMRINPTVTVKQTNAAELTILESYKSGFIMFNNSNFIEQAKWIASADL